MHSIVVESDSQEIVQAVLNPDDYRASEAVLTDECRELMSSFGKATICHCAREANKAAHEAARYSARLRTEEVRMDQPPQFLVPIIGKDMIFV